jgi:oligopeptide transport system substrate-binding protein
MYRAGERNHLIAQAVQQQWFEAFGIRVRLEAIEGKVYFDRISKQDYHMASGNWTADFADAINFLEIFQYKNGGSNNTLWENPRYVELLQGSFKVSDAAQRIQMLAESEKILMEEMPVIPIFYYTMLYVNQPQLKDVVLSSLGQIDFKWASLEDGNKTVAQGDKK